MYIRIYKFAISIAKQKASGLGVRFLISSLCHLVTLDKLFILSEPQMPNPCNIEVQLIIIKCDDYSNNSNGYDDNQLCLLFFRVNPKDRSSYESWKHQSTSIGNPKPN